MVFVLRDLSCQIARLSHPFVVACVLGHIEPIFESERGAGSVSFVPVPTSYTVELFNTPLGSKRVAVDPSIAFFAGGGGS